MFGRDNLLENGQGRYRGVRRSSSWSFRVRVRRLLEGSPGVRHPSVDYQPPLICYTTLEGTTMAFYDLVSIGANMIGIDEPEIHLHPTSQRSLARLLKSNPNQKIIATHSSDIVSAFEADSIAVVRP